MAKTTIIEKNGEFYIVEDDNPNEFMDEINESLENYIDNIDYSDFN